MRCCCSVRGLATSPLCPLPPSTSGITLQHHARARVPARGLPAPLRTTRVPFPRAPRPSTFPSCPRASTFPLFRLSSRTLSPLSLFVRYSLCILPFYCSFLCLFFLCLATRSLSSAFPLSYLPHVGLMAMFPTISTIAQASGILRLFLFGFPFA